MSKEDIITDIEIKNNLTVTRERIMGGGNGGERVKGFQGQL